MSAQRSTVEDKKFDEVLRRMLKTAPEPHIKRAHKPKKKVVKKKPA